MARHRANDQTQASAPSARVVPDASAARSTPTEQPAADSAARPTPLPPATPLRLPDVAEVYVNVGRKDGVHASDLHTLLEEGGVSADDTDYVNVRHRHSFVGVRREALPRVIDALNGATIAGKQALAEEARVRA